MFTIHSMKKRVRKTFCFLLELRASKKYCIESFKQERN